MDEDTFTVLLEECVEGMSLSAQTTLTGSSQAVNDRSKKGKSGTESGLIVLQCAPNMWVM